MNRRIKAAVSQSERDWFLQRCWPLLGMLTAVGLLITSQGCERPKVANRQPVVPVRGEVQFQGKPATGAVLSFHPLGDVGTPPPRPRGTVGKDGVFELTTYAKNDGAPSGDYIITIYWPDASKKRVDEDGDSDELPPDILNGRFAVKGRSALRARIGETPVEFAAVDLASADLTKSGEFFWPQK